MELNFHYESMLWPSYTTAKSPRQNFLGWHHNHFVWVIYLFIGDENFKKREWYCYRGEKKKTAIIVEQKPNLIEAWVFSMIIKLSSSTFMVTEYLYFWNSSRKNVCHRNSESFWLFCNPIFPIQKLLLKVIFISPSFYKNINTFT